MWHGDDTTAPGSRGEASVVCVYIYIFVVVGFAAVVPHILWVHVVFPILSLSHQFIHQLHESCKLQYVNVCECLCALLCVCSKACASG